jgi:hypothetical protein
MDYYDARINVSEAGLMRLCSFIISFLVWQFLFLLALFLVLFGVISFDILASHISPFAQALGLIGITPLLLAILTWKLVEDIVAAYIHSYKKKYLIITKNGIPV